MRTVFAEAPEVTMLDATYNTNSEKYPLLQVVCIDAMSRASTIALIFLESEDGATIIEAMIIVAEAHGQRWEMMKVAYSDRDWPTMSAIDSVFPAHVVRLLCRWHALRAVLRNLGKVSYG